MTLIAVFISGTSQSIVCSNLYILCATFSISCLWGTKWFLQVYTYQIFVSYTLHTYNFVFHLRLKAPLIKPSFRHEDDIEILSLDSSVFSTSATINIFPSIFNA